MKPKLLIFYIHPGGLGPANAYSLVGDSDSGSLKVFRLVDSVDLHVECLSSSIPSFVLSNDLP